MENGAVFDLKCRTIFYSTMQRILFILFFLTNTVVYAQQVTPILSDEDTTDLYNALHTPPSQEQISPDDQAAINDSLTKAGYALKRLKDVINMKKDILWASTLSQRIRDFQDSTFILVSPLMKVQGAGVLIGLVSRVGEINLFNPIDPYVTLYWKINPVTNLEMPFRLQLQVEHSAMLPDSLFEDIELAIQTFYAGKIYESVDETEDDIVGATIEFLDLLEAKVGDRYAPKYMFKVGGIRYTNNFQLDYTQVQKPAGEELVINVIHRKSGLVVSDDVEWEGAVGNNYRAIFTFPDSIGVYDITCENDSFELALKINLQGPINFMAILESTYKTILKEVIMQLIVSLNNTMDEKDSLKVLEKNNIFDIAEIINTNALSVTSTNTINQSSNYYNIDFNDVPLNPDGELQTAINEEQHIVALKSFQVKYNVLRQALDFLVLHKEVVAEFLEPGKLRELGDQIGDDLGTLSANVLIQLMEGGDQAMRTYLFEYLLETSTQIAEERQ
jgi:hypothetical protein